MGPVGVALELVGVGKGLFADGAAVFVVGFPVVRAEQVGGVKSEGALGAAQLNVGVVILQETHPC